MTTRQPEDERMLDSARLLAVVTHLSSVIAYLGENAGRVCYSRDGHVEMDGIVLGPGEGEKVARVQRHHRILAELPELEVVELSFGPDFEGVDPHSHADHVDSFYVLEGEAEFVMGDDTVRVGPGGYVAAPIGVVHGFRNAGGGELRLLNVHAPNVGFAGRLRRG